MTEYRSHSSTLESPPINTDMRVDDKNINWKHKYSLKEKFYQEERESWDRELAAVLDNLAAFERHLRLEQQEIVQFTNEKDTIIHNQNKQIKALVSVNDTLLSLLKKVNQDITSNSTDFEKLHRSLQVKICDVEGLVKAVEDNFYSQHKIIHTTRIHSKSTDINIRQVKSEEHLNDLSRKPLQNQGLHNVGQLHEQQKSDNALLIKLEAQPGAIQQQKPQRKHSFSSKTPKKIISKLKQLVTRPSSSDTENNGFVIHDTKEIQEPSSSTRNRLRKVSRSSSDKENKKIVDRRLEDEVTSSPTPPPRGRQRKVSIVHPEPLAITSDGEHPEVWLPANQRGTEFIQSPNHCDTSLINSVANNFGIDHNKQRESISSSLASAESDHDLDIGYHNSSSNATDESYDNDDADILSEKDDTVGELVEHHRRISIEANAAVVRSTLDVKGQGYTPREVKARDRIRSRSLPQTVNMQFYEQLQQQFITDL